MSNRDQKLPGPDERAVVPFPTGGGVGGYYPSRGYDPEPAASFDPWYVISVLLRRRWLIGSLVVLGGVLGIAATFLMTPMFKASSTIEFQRQETQIMAGGVEPSVVADQEFMQTQLELLRSETLALRVAEMLNLGSDPDLADPELSPADRAEAAAESIQDRMNVRPMGRSRVLQIEYSSSDRTQVAQVVNAMVDGFISSNLERKYNATAYARDFLEQRIVATRESLEDSERQLVTYAQEQDILDLGGAEGEREGNLDASTLTALTAELAKVQADRIAAQQEYAEAQNNPNNAAVLDSKDLQLLRERRATMVADYNDRLGEYQPEYPAMQRLQAQIDTVEREIDLRGAAVLSSLRSNFQAAAAQEQAIVQEMERLSGVVQDRRERQINYQILKRDVDTNRSQYEALLQRLKEISVNDGVGSSLVSVVDVATPPKAPFSPSLPRNLALGLLGGMFIAVGIAFGSEWLDDTIKTPKDVEDKLGLTVLGVVPKQDLKGGNIVESLADPLSPTLEAYYSARTSLRFANENGIPKTLVITSTTSGEGKSSTSFGLGTTLAKSGDSVLIIDADMRRPTFRAASSESIGLSGLLTSNERLEDNIIYKASSSLALLPSGIVPPNPSELLSGKRIREIVAACQQMFDIVIIDAPPVLGLSDAPSLGAIAEGVILIVESGRSRRAAVQNSVNRMRMARTNMIGAILTKFDAKKTDSYYYGQDYGDSSYSYGGDTRKLSQRAAKGRSIRVFDDEDDDYGPPPTQLT